MAPTGLEPAGAALPARRPLRKSVRRLRGFAASFEAQMRATSERTGIVFELHHDRLTAAFLDWVEDFERQKPGVVADRMPYVGFAAGLMLKSLILHDPVRVTALPPGADRDTPAHFWPEGHLYVAYCLNIRGCVLEEDFHAVQQRVPELDDIRTWWSFRENVAEDPATAIAFLDLFSGQEPDWSMPSVFRSGRYQAVARKVFDRIG